MLHRERPVDLQLHAIRGGLDLMHKKGLIWAFTGIICLLLIVCTGCVSTKDSTLTTTGTQIPVDSRTYTLVPMPVATPVTTPPRMSEVSTIETLLPRDAIDRNGTVVLDVAFDKLFQESVNDLTNKTNIVIFEMAQSDTPSQYGYSPVRLHIAAQELGFTADNYYNTFLQTRAMKPENEVKKITYLQYLYDIKNYGYHIADASNYELQGDFPNALAMAQAAKVDLQPIKSNPDIPPTTTASKLFIYLNEYIAKLSAKANPPKS
jgi:hypothetical protein